MEDKIIKDMFGKLKNCEDILGILKEKRVSWLDYLAQVKIANEVQQPIKKVEIDERTAGQSKLNVAVIRDACYSGNSNGEISSEFGHFGKRRRLLEANYNSSKSITYICSKHYRRCPKCFKKIRRYPMKETLFVKSSRVSSVLQLSSRSTFLKQTDTVRSRKAKHIARCRHNKKSKACGRRNASNPRSHCANNKIWTPDDTVLDRCNKKKKRKPKRARCGKRVKPSCKRQKLSKRALQSYIRNAARAGGYGYRFGEGEINCMVKKAPDESDRDLVNKECKAMKKVQGSKRKIMNKAINQKKKKC
ncbi:uncharacterized protein LOC119677313 [Teleopsis dalmanni]|uniref:uncharacterized protein LOC119677313 n=1 Tax=Teleopsis dalmanni TaxID=139649 RepID=UPI0018CCE0E3|nr:uncharacterized protein LOC119677313 [Teleopsis dalmanni]